MEVNANWFMKGFIYGDAMLGPLNYLTGNIESQKAHGQYTGT